MRKLITLIALMGLMASLSFAADDAATRRRSAKAFDELDADEARPAKRPAYEKQAPARQAPAPRQQSIAMGNQALPTIIVVPAQKAKGMSDLQAFQSNPNNRMAIEAINGYLTQRQYEVKSLAGEETLGEVIQMQQDIAETEEDLSYLASLALSADIYIKFSASIEGGIVLIELSAYEAATARLLGSQTSQAAANGQSKGAIAQAVFDAANRAMPGLEKKIKGYWEVDRKNGVQYKVIMKLQGDFDEQRVEDIQDDVNMLAKKAFKRVNTNVQTAKTIDMTVFADMDKFADSQEVYSYIRRGLKGSVTVRKINITKKLILIELK
ncbi:hypothetical protein SAMN05720761_1058 [Fibrobacter sp. UWCM]|jgi:hypothetical protein|uniref:DUF6175 family protein n=1 Tax=unclassified Fibrobacter TaxID=2634177 RepID=UPI0009177FDA|nr:MULTISPECIES: DUF6175 family protein [unclassified Fibrobacter]MBR2059234.1 hypothetical protein [Fibrobacter sp.]MBR2306726.1 hypothetical protein [Fibrobacter sp.]MBR4008676.1 hypothetical protein [Fibrobacter sp.]SHG77688.1 hypothetical protein SAMN05720761_1058 [Fibrobacter sp. UWCM]